MKGRAALSLLMTLVFGSWSLLAPSVGGAPRQALIFADGFESGDASRWSVIYGGSINVESKVNEGTTFIINMPIKLN